MGPSIRRYIAMGPPIRRYIAMGPSIGDRYQWGHQ